MAHGAQFKPNYASTKYLANLVGLVGFSGAIHVAWTEFKSNGSLSTSTDHYGQHLQEPVIFIPGTLGNTLYDVDSQAEIYPFDGIFDLRRLTMDPLSTNRFTSIIGGRILGLIYAGDFVNRLTSNGYTEYMVNDLDERRTYSGCDTTQRGQIPNYFPFAYDWREDVSKNIDKLDAYIQCVKRFYPSTKINMIGHSQGTLIGRKYLLFYGTQDIRAFLPIGGPWWGVPSAIAAMYSAYLGFFIPTLVETIEKTFPSIAQQLPSRTVFDQGFRPLHEQGFDFDGDGIYFGPLDYDQYTRGINHAFQPNFAIWNESIHNVPGQDDWSASLESVEYHNIYTNNTDKATVQGIVFWTGSQCNIGRCWSVRAAKPIADIGFGDMTVPLSILEGGAPQGPNAETIVFPTTEYKHSEQINMPEIQNCVLTVLARGWCEPQAQAQRQASPATLGPDLRFVTVRGMEQIDLTDSQGLTLTADLRTGAVTATSDIQIETLGDTGALLMIPSDTSATLSLRQFPRSYAAVESVKGQSNVVVNELIRFQDITLPPAAILSFTVGTSGISQLRVDENRDGVNDRTINPTVSTSNPNGVDITPPTITFNRNVVNTNSVSVAIAAADASGVQRTLYSFDGATYQPYTAPLVIDPRQTPVVYAFAEDTLSNRSSLYTLYTTKITVGAATSVAETAGTINLPVTLDTTKSHTITVEYAVAGGTATGGRDYTPITGTLTFAPNQAAKTLSVPIFDDLLDESDETLTVTLQFPTLAGFQQRQQVLTILDDDSTPSLQFQSAQSSSDETNGFITATIALSQPSGKPITLHAATTDGSATASDDYTALNQTITIPVDTRTTVISIPLTIKNVYWEAAEEFSLRLDTPTNVTLGPQTTAVMRITNDHVAIRPASIYVNETNVPVQIPVVLSNTRAETVTVDYATRAGWNPEDYLPLQGTLTFPPGTTTQTITLSIIDDSLQEPYEYLVIDLANPTNARVPSAAVGSISIAPNDLLYLISSTIVVDEESMYPFSVFVAMNSVSSRPVSVRYTLGDGTALAGSDYIAQTGIITFPAFVRQARFYVSLINDTMLENDETFSVILSDPVNAEIDATRQQSVITIAANDVPIPTATPLPSNSVLFVTGAPASASDAAVISRLQAMQVQGTNLNVIVKDHDNVTVADAGNGVRLVLISSSIASTKLNTMFKNTPVPVIVWENGLFDDMGMTGSAGFGQTAAATQLTISQPTDPLAAGLSGTVAVHTSAQTMAYASGLPTSAINVAAGSGTPSRSVVWGYESGATMVGLQAPARRVGLFFSDASGSNATTQGWQLFEAAVNWAFGSNPAPTPTATTPTATSSVPTATPTNVPPTATATTIPPTPTSPAGGTNTVLFVIGATPLTSGDAAIQTRLQSLNYTVVIKTASAATTADATGKKLVVISSTVASTTVNTMFRSVAVPVLVMENGIYDDMAMTDTINGTHYGTTAAVTQLTLANTTHPLAAGQSGTVTVQTVAQSMPYGVPSAGAVGIATTTGSATKMVIFGYESGATMVGLTAPARRVGFWFNDTSAANATATGWSLFDAAVQWAAASSGVPATPIATATSVPPTSTRMPPTATATTVLPTTTRVPPTVTATNPPSTATATATPTVTPINTLVRMGTATIMVHENVGSVAITVTLNVASTQSVSVNYALTAGSATANSDYTSTSGTLTFAPGQTIKTIGIAVLEDETLEGAETFTVMLSSPTNAQLGSPSSTIVTIAANDALTMGSATMTVHENAGIIAIPVTLNAPSSYTVRAEYGVRGNTATAGSDYINPTSILRFNPGETTKMIYITILEDGLKENAETFTIDLLRPAEGWAEVGSPSSTIVTIAANDALAFTTSAKLVYESAFTVNVTVVLNAPSSQTVTVNYGRTGGTAKDGSDFVNTSGTLNFTPGETSKNFTLQLVDDGANGELDETVIFTLNTLVNAQLGTPSTITITIRDGCDPLNC